jgi:diguanylate cyclase (GGDEF)-like protein/PAS domain S-box-containing protein
MRLLNRYFTRAWAALPAITPMPRYFAKLALVTLGYVVAARLADYFVLPISTVSPFWPAAALALCACMIWGLAVAPGVWAGATLSTLNLGITLPAASAIGLGSMAEAAVAAWFAGKVFREQSDVVYHERIFRFIAAAIASGAIAATIGTAALATARASSADGPAFDWLAWCAGDASAMLIAGPLLLSQHVDARWTWRRSNAIEAAVLVAVAAILSWVVFRSSIDYLPLVYLSFCPVLWAAVRFPLPAATWMTGATCIAAAWNTARVQGPFATEDMKTSLFLLTTYTGVLSTTGLVLAGLVHQRREAEDKLLAERVLLEQRLHERTQSLLEDIEHRKQIERQLADAQQLAQIGSWEWNTATGHIVWSEQMYRIFGVDKESFVPAANNYANLIEPEDIPMLQQAVRQSLENRTAFQVEHRIRTQFGQRVVLSRGYLQGDGSAPGISLFGTVQDITETKQAETALQDAKARYRTLVDMSPDAILVQQDGRFVFANSAACTLLQVVSIDDILGKSVYDFIHPDAREHARLRLAPLTREDAVATIEEKLQRLDGSAVDVEINCAPIQHNGRPALLFIARDVTERRKSLEQMAYMAHYDALTGLPNRMLFQQRLEHALSIAERPGKSLELLFLDLNRFKNINDTLGHATGDMVLQEAARRLRDILRESDTVARLGGDEFVVLAENIDEPYRGAMIAEKILAAFKPPFLQDKSPLLVGTSIGIASYPADGNDADTLLKNADIAMYRAKETGHGYCYYSPDLNRHTTERLSLEYALGRALEQGELSLQYQPRVEVTSNRITGMEALLRWWHPTLGPIAPDRFIPIAEESGLIVPIGYWTLRMACLQNRLWQDSSPVRLRVSVNMSQRQLADDGLLDNLRAILDDTGLDPHFLEIEITEDTLMTEPDKTAGVVRTLAEMGISVSIDNFGTGYSSLAHLKQFPIHSVKIDSSFVHGLPADSGDSAITRAIISLAHTLECKVTAEGAETQQQFEFLRDNNCDDIQGYYFSAPMAAEVFGDLLKTQTSLHLH